MNQKKNLEHDLRELRLAVDLIDTGFAHTLNDPERERWFDVCLETDRRIEMFSFSNEKFRQSFQKMVFHSSKTQI